MVGKSCSITHNPRGWLRFQRLGFTAWGVFLTKDRCGHVECLGNKRDRRNRVNAIGNRVDYDVTRSSWGFSDVNGILYREYVQLSSILE